ncbi:MAG: hypothetical protein AAGJ67_01465 [Pseudomonadota bacterium]
MSLWSRIFGSHSFIDKSLGALSKTGDAMFFTDEEKAKHKLVQLKEFEPFKLVERYIVLLFATPYVLLHLIVVIGYMRGFKWQPISLMINEAFGYRVLTAIGLYLTGGVVKK